MGTTVVCMAHLLDSWTQLDRLLRATVLLDVGYRGKYTKRGVAHVAS